MFVIQHEAKKVLPIHETEHRDNYYSYKGIKIFGLDGRLPFGIDQLLNVLDRFPNNYWTQIDLDEIHFVDYKVYSAQRAKAESDPETVYVIDPEHRDVIGDIIEQIGEVSNLTDADTIISRKRGLSLEGKDGRYEIIIFSTDNWDNLNDTSKDADNALFISAHELGHLTWKTLFKSRPSPDKGLSREDLILFAKLPASTLQRYLEYKPIIMQEFQNPDNLQKSLPRLLYEEDFAVSHEHYFYWQNLGELDPERNEILRSIYSKF